MFLEMRAQVDSDFEANEEQQGPERRMEQLDQHGAEQDGDMQHDDATVWCLHQGLGAGLLIFTLAR